MIKRLIKFLIISAVIISVICVSVCSAEVYQSDFPSYCPINGGAWAEVTTSQGDACIVVQRNYISDIFSFYGNQGYNILNTSNSTVSGYIYFKNATNYYTNPTYLQCRFQSFGTLEIYVPYSSNYGTRYEWQSLNTDKVLNTNIAFDDSSSDRQNNSYVYTVSEKLQIILVCLVISLLLYFILGRSWRA